MRLNSFESVSPLEGRAPPLLEVFQLHGLPGLAQPRPQVLRGLKQVQEPLPPPQQRRQPVLLLRLGIEEVVKELVPHLLPNKHWRSLEKYIFTVPHLDLPPPPELPLDGPPALGGGDLYVLTKQKTVGATRDAKVVKVELADSAVCVGVSVQAIIGLQSNVHRFAKVYQLETGLGPRRNEL